MLQRTVSPFIEFQYAVLKQTLLAYQLVRAVARLGHSPRGSKTKLFCVKFSDLHIAEEYLVKPRCDQLQSQFLEAKDFADKGPVLMTADVAAVIYPSQ